MQVFTFQNYCQQSEIQKHEFYDLSITKTNSYNHSQVFEKKKSFVLVRK